MSLYKKVRRSIRRAKYNLSNLGYYGYSLKEGIKKKVGKIAPSVSEKIFSKRNDWGDLHQRGIFIAPSNLAIFHKWRIVTYAWHYPHHNNSNKVRMVKNISGNFDTYEEALGKADAMYRDATLNDYHYGDLDAVPDFLKK